MFFSLLLSVTPQPSQRGICFTEHLSPARKEVFPSTWLRAGGGRSRAEPLLSLLQRSYATAASPLATQHRCGGGRPACNKHTHTRPDSTGHHGHTIQKEIWITNPQLKVNILHLSCKITQALLLDFKSGLSSWLFLCVCSQLEEDTCSSDPVSSPFLTMAPWHVGVFVFQMLIKCAMKINWKKKPFIYLIFYI